MSVNKAQSATSDQKHDKWFKIEAKKRTAPIHAERLQRALSKRINSEDGKGS